MSLVVPFRQRTYAAKGFTVETSFGTFKISGTLEGHVDLAVPNGGTYALTQDEMRLLLAAMNGALEDVHSNCLYDGDALLERV